jgi:hypothetical protein
MFGTENDGALGSPETTNGEYVSPRYAGPLYSSGGLMPT